VLSDGFSTGSRHRCTATPPSAQPLVARSARSAADQGVSMSMIFGGVSEPRYEATDQDPVRL
jgi:hypothetical protein